MNKIILVLLTFFYISNFLFSQPVESKVKWDRIIEQLDDVPIKNFISYDSLFITADSVLIVNDSTFYINSTLISNKDHCLIKIKAEKIYIDKKRIELKIFQSDIKIYSFINDSLSLKDYWYSNNYNVKMDDNNLPQIISSNNNHSYIRINSNSEKSRIFLDNKYIGLAPLNINNVQYGEHSILVCSDGGFKYDTLLVIRKNEPIIINAIFGRSLLSLDGIPKDSKVIVKRFIGEQNNLLNERILDDILVIKKELNTGVYNIKIKEKGYESKKMRIWLKPGKHHNFQVKLLPRSKRKAVLYSIIFPGLGQFYSERKTAGSIFSALSISMLGSFVLSYNSLDGRVVDYKNSRMQYQKNIDPEKMYQLYLNMKNKYDKMKSVKRLRNIFLGSLITTYIVNIVDVYMKWPFKNMTHRISVTPKYEFEKNSNIVTSINYTYKF